MYETHFGFHRQPFQSADGSRAFFVSESIRTILPQLLHALRSDLGIAVLTGAPGSGKTTLLRHLQNHMSSEGRAIMCSGANLGTSVDLVGVLLQASRTKAGIESMTKSHAPEPVLQATRAAAMEHMRRTAELWGPVLLLIDDAQLVPLQVLNELRACTEEEWNGRDLVRCLVSAPISFEEQLARTEYAEFSRRIRCHTFLQPLKSGESIRFLQEQIELAGGRLSKVFATPALELIATAADGIPRCLSLLADESLVVAAECGEQTATVQSVRAALGRLQHLQYNWNASPHVDNDESPLLDEEHAAEERTTQLPSVAIAATTSKQSPVHAALSPGVIEFGGPPTAASTARQTTPSTASTVEPKILSEIEPTIADSNHDEESMNSSVVESTTSSVIEFGGQRTVATASNPERVMTDKESSASFEVGRRFFAESSEDSISIENVDDSDIFDLLNTGVEYEQNSWGVTTIPDGSKLPVTIDFPPASAQSSALEIEWTDGNEPLSEPDAIDIAVTDENAMANIDSSVTEIAVSIAESLAADAESSDPPPEEPQVAAAGRKAFVGFPDLRESRMSNRTPVFDRYTWIALGRDVPPGTSSRVSMTRVKQLMLADYGMQAANSSFALCLPAALATRIMSIDQIPMTRTTDASLIEQLSSHSPSHGQGSFVLFGNTRRDLPEFSTPAVPQDEAIEFLQRDSATEPSDDLVVDWLQVDESEKESLSAMDVPAELRTKQAASSEAPTLKIWHDGQLIFSESETGDSWLDADTIEDNSAADIGKATIVPEHVESSTQLSASLDSPVHKTTGTQLESQANDVTQFDNEQFLTLPATNLNDVRGLQTQQITADHEIDHIVETIASMRDEVRQFQQTGRIQGSNQNNTPRELASMAEQMLEPDSLISRSKRRLEEKTSADESTIVPLQIVPDPRSQRVVRGTATDTELAAAGNPASSPQFSRLFTRLWETRRRAAEQVEADR